MIDGPVYTGDDFATSTAPYVQAAREKVLAALAAKRAGSRLNRIGFTGTREGMTEAQSRAFVDLIVDIEGPVELHHGCCVGADEETHWLAFVLGIGSVAHPPIDDKLLMASWSDDDSMWKSIEEPKPYLERNRDIVDATDRLIACPKQNPSDQRPVRSGTWYTVRYAAKRRKPVTIIWADGTVGEGRRW